MARLPDDTLTVDADWTVKMLPWSLNSYRSALEIKNFASDYRRTVNRTELRSSISIVIIDDQKFNAYKNIQTHGYRVTELHDIDSIGEVERYDIVLCDLMGVGSRFDPRLGGASIIKEISINYPTKFIIAYSGATDNARETSVAREYSDEFLQKDSDITDWIKVLDHYTEIISDPYEMWRITRDELIDQETDLREILKIESAYVDAILTKDQKFTKMKSVLEKADLSGNAKGIGQSLIASSIFEFILGM